MLIVNNFFAYLVRFVDSNEFSQSWDGIMH